MSAAIAGIVMYDLDGFAKSGDQSAKLAIVTQKTNFKKGEQIQIQIVNNGTKPIVFSDESYALKITGLSGMLMYSHSSDSHEFITMLLPEESVTIEWDQTKNDGTKLNVGTYKIVVEGFDDNYNKIKESTSFNVLKGSAGLSRP